MLFTAIWTLLAVAYLVFAPTRFPRAAHKFAILGVEALTMLFWFAAWVAVAALWGDWYKPARSGSYWSTGVSNAPVRFACETLLTSYLNVLGCCYHLQRFHMAGLCRDNRAGDAACEEDIERE
jgi:hypothetical protein